MMDGDRAESPAATPNPDHVEVPPTHEVDTMDGSLNWFRGRVQSMLRLRSDRVDDLIFERQDSRRVFLDFVREPARRRLLVWPGEGDDIHAGFDLPAGNTRKVMYFLKQRSFRIEEDGSLAGVLMGDLPPDALEHLSAISHEVLYPILMAGRAKDPDAINKEISDVFHRFLSQVYLTVGQTQGKTLLPLPPRDPNQKDASDQRVVKDKERVHVLESCVVTWTQQIKNVLRHEPPSFIYPGDLKTGTAAEFAYWRDRAQDVTSIDEQLRTSKVQKVLQVLDVTKSTYEKPFQKLVKEVSAAKDEACDVDLHLRPLEKLLAQFSDVPFSELGTMFRPVLHTIHLIFSHSGHFNTPSRLQSILEKFCNNVIYAALQYVNGELIFSAQPEEVEQRLLVTINLFGQLRGTYVDYKSRSEETTGGAKSRTWVLQDELVFNLPDQFVERCYDMIDLVQMASRFGVLKNVQVGGEIRMARSIDQINTEFHDALARVRDTGYDLLDIAAKKYDDDFFEFRRTVRDCERRLGSLIAERMEVFSTLGGAFSFLACFEVMLDRKIILDCLLQREMDMLSAVETELRLVQEAFVAGKDKPPPYDNMPHFSARVRWSRSLADRLRSPIESAQRMLKNIMGQDAGKQVMSTYTALMASLKEFEAQELAGWVQGIDMRLAEKLKQPLLVRDINTKNLVVNFDDGVWALLRETKYFHQLDIEVPEAVRAVYQRADVYQQHAANLQLIVNAYNGLLSSMAEVEMPLMQPKLDLVDEALEEGIEHLNWRNHSIASFIKKSTSYIADASALLKLIQANVLQICELLRSWSTASLHAARKKTAGAEEYLHLYKSSLEARLSSFREDSRTVHALMGEIHLTLQVSRGDPAWKQYVQHVNNLLVTTLRQSIVQSLQSIQGMIDPKIRKESSPPLVEVRLELVAPDVFFNPDVSSNLNGTGLHDLVNFWVSATLGIAKLLPRIDGVESNYYDEIANSEEVKDLVSKIRELADEVFGALKQSKSAYEAYSQFWLREPTEEFSSFIESLKGSNVSQAQELATFDRQITRLKDTESEIKALANRETVVWVSVDAKPMKQALFTLLSKWTFAYTNHLLQKLLLETEEMQRFVNNANAKLKAFADETEKLPLADIMGIITDVRRTSNKTEELFVPWSSTISMLKRFGVEVPSWVHTHVSTAPSQWNTLKKRMYQCRTMLEDTCLREQNRLRKESGDFLARATAYRVWFEGQMPFTVSVDTDFAYQLIDGQRRFDTAQEASALSPKASTLATMLKGLSELNVQEEIFDLKQTLHDGLAQCTMEMIGLKHVWDLVSLVNSSYARWTDLPWQGLDLNELLDDVSSVYDVVVDKNGPHKRWPVFVSLTERLQVTSESIQLMKMLQSPILRQRHWKQLIRVTGSNLLSEADIRIGDMLALNLTLHAREVEDLVQGAEKESEIEAQLSKIEKEWAQLELSFMQAENGQYILQPPDHVLAVLHESLVEVQMLSFNPHVLRNSNFSEQVRTLQHQLGATETLLNTWLLAQHKHSTLLALFSTAIARRECGECASAFDAMEASWDALMSQAASMPNVLEACSHDEREKQVKSLLTKLEDLQAKLVSFLDGQRAALPRFNFLSYEGLLMLLSFENHPKETLPYIRHCFPGIHQLGLEFKNGGESQVFTFFRGSNGERVNLVEPIACDGPVQAWVAQLEPAIQKALREEFTAMLSSLNEQPPEVWITTSALQLAVLCTDVSKTAAIEEALTATGKLGGNKRAMADCAKKVQADVDALVALVRGQDIIAEDRNKTSQVLFTTIGWSDLAESLVANNEKNPVCFAWQSQLRHYAEGDKAVTVKIATSQFDYGWAYLGADLVMTIKTSSSQALLLATICVLDMQNGVYALGGPGIGKTVTIQGTAHALGRECTMYAGDENMVAETLLTQLAGLTCVGAWAVFKTVHLAPSRILSFFGQVAGSILDALRARAQTVEAAGRELQVDAGFALLCTASSDSRPSLPSSLSLILRPVGVLALDSRALVSVWLLSSGFTDHVTLAHQLTNFMTVCANSLSNASQYEWNIRTCHRVVKLATAMRTGRGHEGPGEEVGKPSWTLGRACMELLHSRLQREDEFTFVTLVNHVFFGADGAEDSAPSPIITPQVQSRPSSAKASTIYHRTAPAGSGSIPLKTNREFAAGDEVPPLHPELDESSQLAAQSLHLQMPDGFLKRFAQFNAAVDSSPTVWVLGPASSGKSSLVQLGATQRGVAGNHTIIRSINPKMMPPSRLFGTTEAGPGQRWKDGVLAAIFRDMAGIGQEEDAPHQWLVLDGFVDPSWSEAMLAALPETGHLLLPSQERIWRTPKMKIVIETEDLQYASPAMVGIGNMVNMSASDVGWPAYVQSWLDAREDAASSVVLSKLMGYGDADVIPSLLTFLSQECNFVSWVTEQSLVEMVCSLFAGADLAQSARATTVMAPGGGRQQTYMMGLDERAVKTNVCNFVFSLIWGLGSLLDKDSRVKFSNWFRKAADDQMFGGAQQWIAFPIQGLVFDFYLDQAEMVWRLWSETLPEFRYLWAGSEDTSTEATLVRTPQHVGLQHAMSLLHRAGHPVMVHGSAGCGKTSVVKDFLTGLDPEQVIRATVSLSGQTTPETLQEALEVPLEHKSGRLYAPAGMKKATFFIDDLHLAQEDKYGHQSVLELIRHVLDSGNWFDLHECVERVVQNCSFVAAMSPTMSWAKKSRMRRHFGCVQVEDPTEESLQHIYEGVVNTFFRSFDVEVQRLAQPMVRCTIKILLDLSSVMVPSADKPHYIFNQHDIAKVFRGIMSNLDLFYNPLSVAQLWMFQCQSTFMGRLVNQDDASMCLRIMLDSTDSLNEHLNTELSLGKQRFLCLRQGNSSSVLTFDDAKSLQNSIITGMSDAYPTIGCTAGSPSVEDFTATAALYTEQLSMVTMALGKPGGHVLLLGPGGAGKKTVANMAARLCGHTIAELSQGGPEFDAAVVRNSICNIFWDAGVNRTDLALMVSASQQLDDRALGMLTDALSPSGFAQMISLFSPSRQNDIYTALRGEVRKLGMVDTRENCWMLFNAFVQRHLHVVLLVCTNDMQAWARQALAFPLLLSTMSVFWLGNPSADKMNAFASVYLDSVIGPEEKKKRPEILQITARHMTLVHLAANELLSRSSPADSKASSHPAACFTWYVQAWVKVYKSCRRRLLHKYDMAARAAQKQAAALTRLSDLEAAIEDQRQVVEQKKIVANRLLAQVGQETALLDEQRAVLREDEQMQSALGNMLSELQSNVKNQMDLAAPLLERIEQALSRMDNLSVSELKGVANPPEPTVHMFRAVHILLTPRGKPVPSGDALAWKEVKKMFSKVDAFLTQLQRFNVKDASSTAVRHVEEHYLTMPVMQTDNRDNNIAEGVKIWLVNIVQMFHIYEVIKPKQSMLNQKTKEWEQITAKISDLSGRVHQLENRLTELMGSFQDATEEKNAAIGALDELTASCNIAGKLASSLQASRFNPVLVAKERYELQVECLHGDALVAGAFSSYAGLMDAAGRAVFMEDNVLADLRAQKITVSSSSVLATLSSPAQVASWRMMGLPRDDFFAESAAIALNSASWPLMVDPDGIGLQWLQSQYEAQDVDLVVISQQQEDLVDVVVQCLGSGIPLAIYGPFSTLRPELMSVVLRTMYVKKRATVVDVGGMSVEVHPEFRLFLCTGLSSAAFDPHLGHVCTMVNFKLSSAGLQDSILQVLLESEIRELEVERMTLLGDRHRLQADREHLEEIMLASLSKEEGAVLSDELANELGDHLLRMDEILTSLGEADKKTAHLGRIENVYMEAANYGNLLYQVVQRLQQLRPVYCFGSNVILGSINAGIEKVSKSLVPISRQDVFIQKEDKVDCSDANQVGQGEEDEGSVATGPSPEHHSLPLPPDVASSPTQEASEPRAGDASATAAGDADGEEGKGEAAEEGPVTEAAAETADTEDSPREELPESTMAKEEEEEEEEEEVQPAIRERVAQYCRGMWQQVQDDCCAALLSKDRIVFSVLTAITVRLHALQQIDAAKHMATQEVVEVFLSMSAKGKQAVSSPFPSWLPDSVYAAVVQLAKLKKGSVLQDVPTQLKAFQRLCEHAEPETAAWPDPWADSLNEIEQWVLIQALRPDRALAAASQLVSRVLGCPPPSEPCTFADFYRSASPLRPILALLPSAELASEVAAEVTAARPGGQGGGRVLTLQGENDAEVAEAVEGAWDRGEPVLVERCSFAKDWMESFLSPLMERLQRPGEDPPKEGFKLVLTGLLAPETKGSEELAGMDSGLISACSKFVVSSARSSREVFLRDVEMLSAAGAELGADPHVVRPLVFSLSYLHCMVARRGQFSYRGLSLPTALASADVLFAFQACAALLPKSKLADKGHALPWQEYRHITGKATLGALLSDPWDRRFFEIQEHAAMPWSPADSAGAASWLGMDGGAPPEEAKAATSKTNWYKVSQLASKGGTTTLEVLKGIRAEWDEADGAPVGISSWCEASWVRQQGSLLQRCLGELQFVRKRREISRQDKAKMALDEILERLPRQLEEAVGGDEEDVFRQVLLREIARTNALLRRLAETLQDLEVGLAGGGRINRSVDEVIESLCLDAVPREWSAAAPPSCRPLGAWFSDLVARCEMLEDWRRRGRLPPALWLGGLAYPQSLVAAVLLSHAVSNALPLHEVALQSEVTRKKAEDCTEDDVGPGGKRELLVHGLYLENARWDVRASRLEDLLPQHTPAEMPAVLLRGVHDAAGPKDAGVPFQTPAASKTSNLFHCPVYRTQSRGSTFVFHLTLKSFDGETKWVEAGAAMVLDPWTPN